MDGSVLEKAAQPRFITNTQLMRISNNYIAVRKLIQEKNDDGFEVVEVQDDSIFKGQVAFLPEQPIYMGNTPIQLGDTVLFSKYSPDTHEIDHGGEKLKFISSRDILAVL